jgi:hypothetical protein
MTKLTVSREWLIHEATSIEQSAQESLRAWILLGKMEFYGQAMSKAVQLRRIAEVKSISERRFLLRELGYNC